jgi:integrase
MATIQERITQDGKVTYRVQVRLRGYPAQTASFERKTDARKWAQQVESSIREGRHFKTAESKKHTLGEMIDRYIESVIPTKKVYGQRQILQLNWWKNQIGSHLLSEVTPALIAEQRDKLLQEVTYRGVKRSNSTTVRYMAAISHAFSTAVNEWGWLDDSPMRKVAKPKEPRGRVQYLNDQERVNLLEVCKGSTHPYLYTVVVLALATGMRLSEILHLTWSSVDFERRCIVLHMTKNGERRVVPLSTLPLNLLMEIRLKNQNASLLVFAIQKGQNLQKVANIRSAWDRAVIKAGLVDFRFHDLRHSCASYLAMNGASLAEIAEVLGHKTLQMVKRYAHLSEVHTASVVQNMNEKIFG